MCPTFYIPDKVYHILHKFTSIPDPYTIWVKNFFTELWDPMKWFVDTEISIGKSLHHDVTSYFS